MTLLRHYFPPTEVLFISLSERRNVFLITVTYGLPATSNLGQKLNGRFVSKARCDDDGSRLFVTNSLPIPPLRSLCKNFQKEVRWENVE